MKMKMMMMMLMTMAIDNRWMLTCFVLLLLISSNGHQVASGSNHPNTDFKSSNSDLLQFHDSFSKPRKVRDVAAEVISAKVVTYSPGRPYVDKKDSGLGRSASDPIIFNQEVNQSSVGSQGRGIADPSVFPVTFRSADAYLLFNWKIYSTFSIYFQIRTYQSDGLVLFTTSGVVDNDFLAVELVSGQVRYVFDTGGGARAIQSTLGSALNDGDWHLVGIVRSDLNRQTLVVDDWSAFDRTPPDVKSVHFDLNDDVYVGGVPVSVLPALPRQLRSTSGFHGCMASVVVNGKTRNLMEELVLQPPPDGQAHIVAGCEGPSTDCQRHVCENEGRCEQQWSSYKCDCDHTSFTGTACNDESVSYRFGHAGGLVTFTFAAGEWPDTRTDQVALGLMTTQGNAVIFRMTSGSSSDFMEMEIVDGNIFVVYNMGLSDHVVGDQFEKVNDGQYHVVRFTRDGANATIQVDNLPVQFRNATGNQLTTFNHQMKVMVGGRLDSNSHLTRIFQGIISGLVMNGIRVLDLASDTDPRIGIDGDVELEVRPLIGLSRDHSDNSRHRTRRPGSKFPSHKSKQNRTRGGRYRHVSPPVAVVASRQRERPVLDQANSSRVLRLNVSGSSGQSSLIMSADGSGRGVRCAAAAEDDDEDGNCSWTSSGESSNDDDSSSSRPPLPLLRDGLILHAVGSSSGGSRRTSAHALNFTTEVPSRRSNPLDGALGRGIEALPAVTEMSSSVENRGATTDSGDPGGFGLGQILSREMAVIVGVSSGLLLILLVLSFAVYRYRSKDQGSYKVDNRDYTLYEACDGADENGAMYRLRNLKLNGKAQKKTVKEWYV